jgi:hypothetical protein
LTARQLLGDYEALIDRLPEACFSSPADESTSGLEVPLLELVHDPAGLIEALGAVAFNAEARQLGILHDLREWLKPQYLSASGYLPEPDDTEAYNIVQPTDQRGKSAAELADMYLRGTPLRTLLDTPVPFEVPLEARFEHCHILGGTGHGKTQLLQRMIHADLVAAQTERRSVVVIDSQGDLINKLMRLALFDPATEHSLADRLVVIDPADIEFPAALNLFDAHLDRIQEYRPIDRERVLNGVVELYEAFFGDMLGAELTQKQGVIFRYLARLMVTIPDATIHTLMRLMDDGAPFKPQMAKLDGSARFFFETEFFHSSFAATKKQILRRLWGVLSTPAFERMFAQKENKLDLYEAMNSGKIILVSTAKDLLKEDGSALFGRFFIALLKQAALERSVLAPERRTPTFVYVDEAQEYFDDSIETILNQARKFKVGLTMAHQTLDQLTPRLRAALNSNTSLKCVGGVSAKDARGMADELHTTTDFIESVRRRGDRTEFAVWLKQTTPSAIRLSVPLGFLERQLTLDDETLDALTERNRRRYCGTLADAASDQWARGYGTEQTGSPPAAPPTYERPAAPPREYVARGEPPPATGPAERPRPQRPAMPERQSGKGGPKHRYLQTLVKGLGEQQGFKATVEAPLPGGAGQVDVLLERPEMAVAFEISVTTPVEWERENVRKCLMAGYGRIALVLAKSNAVQGRYQAAVLDGLPEDERSRLSFLSPEEVPDYIAALAAPPEPSESIVKGYRVKVSRTSVSPEMAKARREEVARLMTKSLAKQQP